VASTILLGIHQLQFESPFVWPGKHPQSGLNYLLFCLTDVNFNNQFIHKLHQKKLELILPSLPHFPILESKNGIKCQKFLHGSEITKKN